MLMASNWPHRCKGADHPFTHVLSALGPKLDTKQLCSSLAAHALPDGAGESEWLGYYRCVVAGS